MKANVFIDLAQNKIKASPSIPNIENIYGDVFLNDLNIKNCYLFPETDSDGEDFREFEIACDNEWHNFVNRLNSSIDIVAFLKTFDTLNVIIVNHRGCVICGET